MQAILTSLDRRWRRSDAAFAPSHWKICLFITANIVLLSALLFDWPVGATLKSLSPSVRFFGGMLTNFSTVRKSVNRMVELEDLISEDSQTVMKKKERQKLAREHEKLVRNVGGIRNMNKRPDALLVIDTGYESIAVKEARKLGIPVIGVVDTNNIPDNVDYVIPGNDDSTRAVQLYLTTASAAIQDARAVQLAGNENDEFVEVVDQED